MTRSTGPPSGKGRIPAAYRGNKIISMPAWRTERWKRSLASPRGTPFPPARPQGPRRGGPAPRRLPGDVRCRAGRASRSGNGRSTPGPVHLLDRRPATGSPPRRRGGLPARRPLPRWRARSRRAPVAVNLRARTSAVERLPGRRLPEVGACSWHPQPTARTKEAARQRCERQTLTTRTAGSACLGGHRLRRVRSSGPTTPHRATRPPGRSTGRGAPGALRGWNGEFGGDLKCRSGARGRRRRR